MTVPKLDWGQGGPPGQARLLVRSERLDDAVQVLAALRSPGAQGWICYTDQVLAVDDAGDIPAGRVLSAELLRADGVSVNLRQQGECWALTSLAESDQGEPVLFFDQGFESSRTGGAWRMSYRCYWALAPGLEEGAGLAARTWSPWVAAFRGWERQRGGEA